MLRRHLRLQHGLERAAYCARWQLPPDHPITAPEYSARCSALAKDGRCADRCRARRACRTNAAREAGAIKSGPNPAMDLGRDDDFEAGAAELGIAVQ